ncbi:MAG: HAMP domain-containing histidine kinase [Desulfobacterales bacterium]|nr:HAMP domain-containing histidine kinase [Desulfobacterales bacterium]
MKAGDEEGFFKELEREFESTFRELIPGILHNFASPLNGILGRSELLEGRAERLKLIINNNDNIDAEILEGCKKIIYDAGLIAKEANRFFSLFNDVTGKFQMLSDTALRRINLSELVKAEMKFLQFYPDFNHNINKKLTLGREIPEISGVKADYSISLSTIIRHSVSSIKNSELKELIVSTGHDDSHVYVKIEDTGAPIPEIQIKELIENWNSACYPLTDLDEDKRLLCALFLLKKYGALFHIAYESGFNVISIRIPYRSEGQKVRG